MIFALCDYIAFAALSRRKCAPSKWIFHTDVAAGILACRRAAASSPAGKTSRIDGRLVNFQRHEPARVLSGRLEARPLRQAGMPDATICLPTNAGIIKLLPCLTKP
jgi:hypothetical protein